MKKIVFFLIATLLLAWCSSEQDQKTKEVLEAHTAARAVLNEKPPTFEEYKEEVIYKDKKIVKNRMWNDVSDCYNIYWDLWLYFSYEYCRTWRWFYSEKIITQENWMAWNDWEYEKKFDDADSYWWIIFTNKWICWPDVYDDCDDRRIATEKNWNKFCVDWNCEWWDINTFWYFILLDNTIYDKNFDIICLNETCWFDVTYHHNTLLLTNWWKYYLFWHGEFQTDVLNRYAFDDIEVFEDDSFRSVVDWVPTLSYLY